MFKRISALFVAALIVLPLALFGCKGKVENTAEAPKLETSETVSTIDTAMVTSEPAQTVATETIPPTAAPQIAERQIVVPQGKQSRDKDIQRALKNAGYYTGAIDGKIGPRTKAAIEEFQRKNELTADGKVGPKTWAALEKYLTEQQQ